MSLCHEPSTVSTSWEMLQICGRILLGPASSMRWRNMARFGSVSQLYARGTQDKLGSSPSLDNCQILHLWVWARALSSTSYLHPNRWLPDPMRFQAFLWTYLPILGKEDYSLSWCNFSPLSQTLSAMRILTITRVHGVTKAVHAWYAYVSTSALGSVVNPAGIASSRYPM